MRNLSSRELRQLYLDFFRSKGHAVIPSASLIPENDPTVLFTTAGMHPLVPYLMGQKHPAGTRLTDVQKCVRTGDIDEVGDTSHCTFFEMLGNWSLGDYFKARQPQGQAVLHLLRRRRRRATGHRLPRPVGVDGRGPLPHRIPA